MRQVLLSFLFCITFSHILLAGKEIGYPHASFYSHKLQKTQGKLAGFNIKVSPAIFWKTIGVELEIPLSKRLSLNTGFFGKLGRMDGKKANMKIKSESFLEDGIRIELACKYYLKGNAPDGFYLQSNVAFSQIVYFDGTTKPYSINDNWKKFSNLNPLEEIKKPNPLSFGLSGGYHINVLGDHVTANFMLGVQANFDSEGKPFVSAYVFPALGYKF